MEAVQPPSATAELEHLLDSVGLEEDIPTSSENDAHTVLAEDVPVALGAELPHATATELEYLHPVGPGQVLTTSSVKDPPPAAADANLPYFLHT